MGAAGVGIMASLYGNRVDTGMTLELSMEINKKLQVKPGPYVQTVHWNRLNDF